MAASKEPTGDHIRIADVVVAAFPEKVFHRGIPVTPTGKFSAQVVDAEGKKHWARSLDTKARPTTKPATSRNTRKAQDLAKAVAKPRTARKPPAKTSS